jgi:hypothetical protein
MATKPSYEVAQMVLDFNLLQCAELDCTNIVDALDPRYHDWTLSRGWWWCPEHTQETS